MAGTNARPRITAPPKLLVVEGQLVIDWPPGPKPAQLVITTDGYEAMINQLNFGLRRMAHDQKVVAAARRIVASLPKRDVQSATANDDQPAGQPGVDTSMSATPPE